MSPTNTAKIILRHWPAKMLSLGAAILIVFFNDISALQLRVISVPLETVAAEDFLPATEMPSSVRVSLRGEEEEIVGILSEDLRAYIDLSTNNQVGLRNSSVIIERLGNALNVDPLEISVEPSQISVRIENRRNTNANINPIINGRPPAGYEVLQIGVSPSTIEVSGPESIIEQVTTLDTSPIDLSERRESFISRVSAVDAFHFLEYPNGNIIEVTIEIGEAQITNTYTGIPVEISNLRPTLSLVLQPEVDLRLTGRYSLLQTFDTTLIQITVDASDINTPGEYELPVEYTASEDLVDIEVQEINPSTIVLTVE